VAYDAGGGKREREREREREKRGVVWPRSLRCSAIRLRSDVGPLALSFRSSGPGLSSPAATPSSLSSEKTGGGWGSPSQRSRECTWADTRPARSVACGEQGGGESQRAHTAGARKRVPRLVPSAALSANCQQRRVVLFRFRPNTVPRDSERRAAPASAGATGATGGFGQTRRQRGAPVPPGTSCTRFACPR